MPPYDVVLTKTARKVYEKLPSKLKQGVDRCFIRLESFPKAGNRVRVLEGSRDFIGSKWAVGESYTEWMMS